jgi:ribosomal protein S18 acetylase RimI-like enzyme
MGSEAGGFVRPARGGGAGFVRPARGADAENLARVQVASWRAAFAGIVPDALLAELTSDDAQKVWRDRWREAITNPPTSRHRVLVATEPRSGAAVTEQRSGAVATEQRSGAAATEPRSGAAATEQRSGAVAGFVSAGPATDADRWPGTDAELYELRVEPAQTGRGHGSRLLHAAVDTLVSDGFRTLSMWALETDRALLAFLESSGWAADGARGELDVGVSVPVVRLHTALSE